MSIEHKKDCKCCYCCDLEAAKQMGIEALKTYGWFAHYVSEDPDMVYGINYHTHGVQESFNHPDFQIVFPTPPQVCHQILFIIIDRVKQGEVFEADKHYEEILGNGYLLKFIEAEENGRKVLRLIFPGKDGKLDIDEINEKFQGQYL